ncbi:hypothetical protein GOP47_0020142, partial [Adiantum capillus-veneris]
MESSKRVGSSSLSSAKKKRKSQPKLDAFLIKRTSSVQGGNTLTNVENAMSNVSNVNPCVDNMSGSAKQGLGSKANGVDVAMSEVVKITKRRWRQQWNLLHPWAYLCKNMLNEEIIKCTFCEECKKLNVYICEGSSAFMISALHDHSLTNDHTDSVRLLNAKKRMEDTGRGPLDDGMDSMVHLEQMPIVTCMKLVYFCACEDIPLDKYLSHCKFLREMHMPNMPASEEYGSH